MFLHYLRRIFSFLSSFWYPFKKNQNRVSLDHKSKLELENWFSSKHLHPYATNTEITILALKTKMDEKKVKKWIENKRVRLKLKENSDSFKYFSKNDKGILRDYYNSKTKLPGPEDLMILENVIQKDKLKIRAWFNFQRFRENKI